jgi:hypothetical protein
MDRGQAVSPRPGDQLLYIQRRAAEYDARFVTVGPLVFFSTQPIEFQETDTDFAIGWKGNYNIEGRAFVYADRQAGRIITILGYPTAKIAQLG